MALNLARLYPIESLVFLAEFRGPIARCSTLDWRTICRQACRNGSALNIPMKLQTLYFGLLPRRKMVRPGKPFPWRDGPFGVEPLADDLLT